MRPEHLTLKGFGAFRDKTQIDFSGVELFALTGPTGAGKTTILDGICFALYGSVPRHGKGAVAPIVTQGTMEANVGLVFSVDEQVYQVARRVRKDAKGRGANTDEASLEHEGSVLAIGAGPVTQKVTELLGLDFDQFTTCVLLPQGEFARFLQDKPAGRQELLTALLDLEIYDRIGQKALERQRQAEGQLAMIDQRLSDLGSVTEADLESIRRREQEIVELLAWLEETLPELMAMAKESDDLEREAKQHKAMLDILKNVRVPEDLAAWKDAEVELRVALDASRVDFQESQSVWETVSAEAARFPPPTQLQQWIEGRRALVSLTAGLAPELASVESHQEALAGATAALAVARGALAATADADRAAHLRRGLGVGDPCPVCGQPLGDLPPEGEVGSLDLAAREVELAESREAKARSALAAASSRADKLEARLSELTRQLEGVADLDDLEATSRALSSHLELSAAARARLAAAKSRYEDADSKLRQLREREARLRSHLQTVWSGMVQGGLEPPSLDFEDVASGWSQLEVWRQASEPRLRDGHEKATLLLTELGQRHRLVTEDISDRLAKVDLSASTHPRDLVVDSLATVRSKRERVEEVTEEARVRSGEREGVALLQQRSKQLGQELRADRFKKWLFDEVFASLVAGANDRLSDLTRGQYELVMEGRDFEVVDNLSAGNRRSVKTLSGGETFLVSLALALSLADQVAATASANTEAAGRLDSFFLDEGFGTLDAESMDVVATVITELGAAGKTVGIVTHVSELAEQMPVRFQVEKGPDSASVSVERA